MRFLTQSHAGKTINAMGATWVSVNIDEKKDKVLRRNISKYLSLHSKNRREIYAEKHLHDLNLYIELLFTNSRNGDRGNYLIHF